LRRKVLTTSKGNDRRQQETPKEVIDDLLGAVRSQFYGEISERRWFQDRDLILRNVVLYFAHWLNERGVTLPTTDYKRIVLDVLQTIKRHGNTSQIKYLPAYLAHCLQTHLRHHGEEYYEAAKRLRHITHHVIDGIAKLAENRGPDPISVMADLRSSIKVKGGRKKGTKSAAKKPVQPAEDSPQLSLF